ncbi:Fur family transcriptional regulator [Aliikangiella coralliicola]|uniref:Transcriptional repressor n=1 Tax=Aliikangiella coralliicola TaxID=2592383 RepID=A0A545UGG6_9GAMM|nr:transcriptional repressor [Aliikangiella coralliicola]TQV88561.1 transcriptional repressor [Aliikangiella coralliicola]
MSTKKVAENLLKIVERADEKCKHMGVKLTTKRKQVLMGLVKSEKAISAYELADYYTQEFEVAMPPMSVYRILDFLQQAQLVHKLNIANKYVACSHITCDHAHEIPQFLICSKCQQVEEITIKKSIIENLQLNVEKAGFRLLSPQLEMNCLCEHCMVDAA